MNNPVEFYGDKNMLMSLPLNDSISIEIDYGGIYILEGNNDITSKYFIIENPNQDIPPTVANLWAVLDIMRNNITKEG